MPTPEVYRKARKDTLVDGVSFSTDAPEICADIASSCLSCPLSRCRYDQRRDADDLGERNAKVFNLRKNGIPLRDIQTNFKISERTIHRIMQNGPYESPVQEPADTLDTIDALASALQQRYKARKPLPPIRRRH